MGEVFVVLILGVVLDDLVVVFERFLANRAQRLLTIFPEVV